MDAEERAEGRKLVWSRLIGRCAEAGMVRPRGMSVEVHKAVCQRLAERLAYMSDENLVTLAELVIENATGVAHNVWPSEATVIGLANALQRCPAEEHRIVKSWLASVEGPQAVAGGYEVELYQFLARHRRPPLAMDMRKIRARAQDSNRQVQLIRDRIARDVASDSDREWLQWYVGERQRVREIVKAGEGKRVPA